jgi:hypothetical protein
MLAPAAQLRRLGRTGTPVAIARASLSAALSIPVLMLRHFATRVLAAVSLLLATATAQQSSPPTGERTGVAEPDPAYEALLARLADRPAAVADAIAQLPSPAARARLQAATGPSEQRAMAMLAVARAFPGDPEADLALLAAATALLQHEGRGDAVPELAAWVDEIGERPWFHDRARGALLPVLLGIRGEIAARRARGGDAKVLDEAMALLTIASVSRTSEPVWLRREARFPVPADLREPIELAWHPRAFAAFQGLVRDSDRLDWRELLALAEPVQRAGLEPGKVAKAEAVPYGHYLLAVRSQATPWWGVVPVEVSDLEAFAMIEDHALVLATWAEGRAIGARYELATRDALERGELDGSAKVLPLEPAANHAGWRHELRLASEFGPARLQGEAPGAIRRDTEQRWLLHAMVDRPVAQPGETVQGRIVLRRCAHEGDGRMRVPLTSAAGACDVRVRMSFGDAGEEVRSGRTDERGLFAFAIEVPEVATPKGRVSLKVEVPDVDAEGKALQLDAGGLFAIAHFERAATSLATEGPELLPESRDAVEVAAVVRYASGAPVDGQLVHAVVEGQTTALRTGADGRASLRVPLAEWQAQLLRTREGWRSPADDLEVVFRTTGPDGTEQSATHVVRRFAVRQDPVADRPWRHRHDEARIDVEPAVVGRTCRVVAHGRAGARALLVVGRSRHARAFSLQFDENGRAVQAVDVLRVDWPRLDVTLADRETMVEDFAFVTLAPAVEAVVEVMPTTTPGSDLDCRVRSQRPGSLVTLAVVDERVYAIEEDRTREPTAELRPGVAHADWQRMRRAKFADPDEVLASLLRNGRVPELGEWSFAPAVPGSGGPAMGAGDVAPPARADFRAVAHFETAVADANGVASFRVRMPSDLTTWRLSAVVVDSNGEGALARAATSTRVPWSVEPVVPRGVREGDTFSLPLVVAREADAKGAAATGATAVEVVVRTEPKQIEVTRTTVSASVGAGAARMVAVPMRAIASGEAKLLLELRSDAVLDRSERTVAIVRDAVSHPIVVAQRSQGTVRVPMPEGASVDEELVVDVMLGDAAVWSRLELDLAVYPYGCAEQTLSRLLPYFAAVRASARRGEAVPAMDEAFRRRLRAGLARLRQLRAGASHFAFWPGGEADVEISVLVKHGLAVLREAGVDLAAERLDVAGGCTVPAPMSKRADETAQRAFALAVEQAAAALRLAPEATRARALAAVALPALDAEPAMLQLPARLGLSAGAIARLGLALLAAGERDGARACLHRLDRGVAAGDGVVTRAGEDPLAVQAMQLELRLALDDDPVARDRAIADLVLACAAGRGSTYAQACASAALALAVPRTARREARVRVEVRGETRELHLASDRADAGRARFARGGEVVVRGPEGATLLVRVTAMRSAPGSSHPAWRSPIAVERALHVLPDAIDAAAREHALRAPLDAKFPLVDGPLPAGRPVLLVVRATSPRSMRHVVVECPLPCGFELLGDSRDVERLAAHVAFVADLEAHRPFERRLLLVPTTVGRFAWPPTVAAPMYAGGLDGGSAGSFVEVVAPAKGTEPAFALWAAPRTPTHDAAASVDNEPDPLAELFTCWQLANDGKPDGEELERRTARALGFDPATANPWVAVVALDDWLDERRHLRAFELEAGAFEAWLVGLLLEAFACAMRTPIPTEVEDAVTQIEAANYALAHVADEGERVCRRLALLRRAMAGAPDTVAAVLDELPEDPLQLVGWPGAFELLHAALAHEDATVREAAFDRMMPEQQALLPLAVILRARQGEWEAAFVRGLVASERHAREFELALHDADLAFAHRAELFGLVPAEWWLRMPLAVFERLADEADEDERADAWSVTRLADLVARGVASDGELIAAFASTDDAFRVVLAHALLRRGVHEVGAPQRAGDASFPVWAKAIRLGAQGVDEAIAMLRTLCDDEGRLPTVGAEELVAWFVRALVVERGSPQQVGSIAPMLGPEAWARAWARFDVDQRVQLVDRFQTELADAFQPATEREAEAIWRFLLRNKDVDRAMDNLTATTAGVRCARRHVEQGDGGALAAAVREAFAWQLDLDESTLEAPVGDEGDALLATLRRSGRAAEFTVREHAWLDRLRRHLGASAPLR